MLFNKGTFCNFALAAGYSPVQSVWFSQPGSVSPVQSAWFSQSAAAVAAQFSQSAYVGSFLCEVVGARRAPNEGPKGPPMPSMRVHADDRMKTQLAQL